MNKFAAAIGKLSRAVARKERASTDLVELVEGRYPPGGRPFVPGTFVRLQSPLNAASEFEHRIEVVHH